MKKMGKYFYPWERENAFELIPIIAFAILILFIYLMPTKASAVSTEIQDTYIDEEYQEYCIEIASHYGIQPELIMAIIEVESSGNCEATNGDCVGLCQINKYAWKDLEYQMQIGDLFNPYENIQMCCEVLSYYRDQQPYGSEVAWVLMKYNGFKGADEYMENGWMTKYAEKVLERSAELEELHYKN